MYYTAPHAGTTEARTYRGHTFPRVIYSRETSRPKTLDFAQSFMTKRRFRANSFRLVFDAMVKRGLDTYC